MTLAKAVAEGKKLKTDIECRTAPCDMTWPSSNPRPGRLARSRSKRQVSPTTRSFAAPTALALRGTKVSLFEQPSFIPEAISLTGRASM